MALALQKSRICSAQPEAGLTFFLRRTVEASVRSAKQSSAFVPFTCLLWLASASWLARVQERTLSWWKAVEEVWRPSQVVTGIDIKTFFSVCKLVMSRCSAWDSSPCLPRSFGTAVGFTKNTRQELKIFKFYRFVFLLCQISCWHRNKMFLFSKKAWLCTFALVVCFYLTLLV